MTHQIGRRELLKSALAATAATGLSRLAPGRVRNVHAADNALPKRRMGKTGYEVSLLSLGAGLPPIRHEDDPEAAVELINHVLDVGINYIDTAESYGVSEINLGEVMKDRREEVFLVTKSYEDTYDEALRATEASLERLQTDYLDMCKHHAVMSMEALDQVGSSDGALRALERLRDEGVIRHIGITSHTPAVMTEALERHDFECVLIPINPAHMIYGGSYDPEELEEFLASAAEKDVGIMAMKVLNNGDVLNRGVTVEEAIRYALSKTGVCSACVGMTSLQEVDENVEIVRNFQEMSGEEQAELEQRAQG